MKAMNLVFLIITLASLTACGSSSSEAENGDDSKIIQFKVFNPAYTGFENVFGDYYDDLTGTNDNGLTYTGSMKLLYLGDNLFHGEDVQQILLNIEYTDNLGNTNTHVRTYFINIETSRMIGFEDFSSGITCTVTNRSLPIPVVISDADSGPLYNFSCDNGSTITTSYLAKLVVPSDSSTDVYYMKFSVTTDIHDELSTLVNTEVISTYTTEIGKYSGTELDITNLQVPPPGTVKLKSTYIPAEN